MAALYKRQAKILYYEKLDEQQQQHQPMVTIYAAAAAAIEEANAVRHLVTGQRRLRKLEINIWKSCRRRRTWVQHSMRQTGQGGKGKGRRRQAGGKKEGRRL